MFSLGCYVDQYGERNRFVGRNREKSSLTVFDPVSEQWHVVAHFRAVTGLVLFFSRTPLMLAVAYGHIDAVSLLLEKEASVDAADLLGCTALHRGVTSFL